MEAEPINGRIYDISIINTEIGENDSVTISKGKYEIL